MKTEHKTELNTSVVKVCNLITFVLFMGDSDSSPLPVPLDLGILLL